MFRLLYRLNDGVVEEIEELDENIDIENVFDDREYKNTDLLPDYNKHRQFLKVINDEIIIENKVLSPEVEKEIQKIEVFEEIQNLKSWFNVYYSQHEQKYRRLSTLNLLTDEGTDPNEELVLLYNDAEIKRKRIQELEENA